MNIVTNNKWIGQSTICPDGVDKVTGRAAFAADTNMPGMIWGKVLRSPHPHARIKSIDTSKAEKLPGVKAVVTARDIVDFTIEKGAVMLGIQDMRWMCRNVMAREKALFPGHPIAAVAATTEAIAAKACELIEVDYEVLPFAIEIDDAIKPDAPILHEFNKFEGKPSNIAGKQEVKKGDIARRLQAGRCGDRALLHHAAGASGLYRAARLSRQRRRRRQDHDLELEPGPVHGPRHDGLSRRHAAERHPRHPRRDRRRFWRQDHRLSRTAGDHPVEEIRPPGEDGDDPRGSDAGDRPDIRLEEHGEDRCEERRHHRRRPGHLLSAGRRVPGSPIRGAVGCSFSPYDIPHVLSTGFDVVSNRSKVAAYRAPGAPIGAYAVECVLDEIAEALKMDPLELRLKNAAKQGTKAAHGPVFPRIGYIETLEAAKNSEHYKAPLGKLQGRGVASGFWFNAGGESSAQVNITEDGNVVVTTGHPDIGGSRAAIANICAELLGIDYRRVSVLIGDTATVGFSNLTGGSRVLFASAIVVTQSAEKIITTLRERAAKIWEIDPEAVKWENGAAHPASPNAGEFPPLTLADLAAKAPSMGGPIGAGVQLNTEGAEGGFGTHICDVEVDVDLGIVRVIRYTAVQDVGRAIHPAYVEGQMQGGVAQGIGWALNEEYIYNKQGKVDNPGFLDYRMPVCSDLPMLDTIMVEVPNPKHPQGVKGVGEVPLVPVMAAVANAVHSALGKRFYSLPMSPPKVVEVLETPTQQAAE